MKNILLLIAVVILGLGLRAFGLGSIPASLNRDEAALGYNAFLLSETGKDEWQQSWPVALESFGDFKLIGYPVFVIPFIKVFGLHDWVVKMPSVLAGTFLIVITYAWAKKLSENESTALVASLAIAIAPVFGFYSRIAFEANVALSLVTASIWLFFFPFSKKWLSDLIGIILMILAVVTYNTPLLLLPFIVLGIIYVRGIRKPAHWGIVAGVLATLCIGMIVVLSPLTAQKKGITIFSDITVQDQYGQYRESLSPPWKKVLGNKYLFYGQLATTRFVQSLSPAFMVWRGGTHPWHQFGGFAHLSTVMYLLGWIGIGYSCWLFWSKPSLLAKPEKRALLALILLTPLALAPSVITVDSPHATRSLLFFWGWVVTGIVGSGFLIQNLSRYKVVLVGLLIVWGGIDGVRYWQNYFTTYQTASASLLRAGIPEVIAQTASIPNVAWVDPEGYDYILVAWYAKLAPTEFWQTQRRQQANSIGFKYGEHVAQYHFIAHPADRVETEKRLVHWTGSAWQVIE